MLNPIKLYNVLKINYHSIKWWPVDDKYHQQNNSDPRFEVIIGAILTQNTAWTNVEKAINNLKEKNILNIEDINKISASELALLIRPSGFFNQKVKRLQTLAKYLRDNYNSELNMFFQRKTSEIRKELLSLNGIGPETADSILLYAGSHPVFVVDAYTKRLCKRLPITTGSKYEEIQNFFQQELSKKVSKKNLTQVYNELHAYIVNIGKDFCRKKPRCKQCYLQTYCDYPLKK